MSFDISRLRRSDRIIGISAIALFIFMFFFKWYGGSASSSVGGVSFSTSANGWHTFTNSRWIWLLTIIVALLAVAVDAGVLKIESPVHPGAIVAGLGALSTVLILYRIVHHPSGGTSGTIAGVHYSSSYGIKIGIWLGLIAAVGVTYGGYLRMQDDGASLSDVHQQASSAVSAITASGGSSGAAPTAGTETAAPPIPPPVTPAGGASSGEPPPSQ